MRSRGPARRFVSLVRARCRPEPRQRLRRNCPRQAWPVERRRARVAACLPLRRDRASPHLRARHGRPRSRSPANVPSRGAKERYERSRRIVRQQRAAGLVACVPRHALAMGAAATRLQLPSRGGLPLPVPHRVRVLRKHNRHRHRAARHRRRQRRRPRQLHPRRPRVPVLCHGRAGSVRATRRRPAPTGKRRELTQRPVPRRPTAARVLTAAAAKRSCRTPCPIGRCGVHQPPDPEDHRRPRRRTRHRHAPRRRVRTPRRQAAARAQAVQRRGPRVLPAPLSLAVDPAERPRPHRVEVPEEPRRVARRGRAVEIRVRSAWSMVRGPRHEHVGTSHVGTSHVGTSHVGTSHVRTSHEHVAREHAARSARRTSHLRTSHVN
jgi:hypothetical protein